MGSIFTTADKAVLRGNKKKKISVPVYMQFVPGIVIDVVTSSQSRKAGSQKKFTNTIIAKPHMVSEGQSIPLISELDGKHRYFPLFRGMVDVPVKGDPVLLCTIGGQKY